MNEKNYPCEIIRDLLPLCAEGLCSGESRAAVERHVQDCADCRRLYEGLPADSLPEAPVPDQTTALRRLNRKLRQSRFTKAMAAVFCVLLVLFGVWNAVWYVDSYRPYRALCAGWERSDYGKGTTFAREENGYSCVVKLPGYLGMEGGFASVAAAANPVQIENGAPLVEVTPEVTVLFVWLDKDCTQYGIDITKGNVMYQMCIDKELHLIPTETMTEEDQNFRRELIEKHREEIEALLTAAQEMWGEKLG